MYSEEVRVGKRRKEVLWAGKPGLRAAELTAVYWAPTVCRCAQYLGTQPHWDAGEERWKNGMWGPQKHFPNCDHLSSCKTQTLIWTWLEIVWAGEVWLWG